MGEGLEVLEEFSTSMRDSGYSLMQMRRVLVVGLVGYQNTVDRSQAGNFPLPRSTSINKGERRLHKLVAKSNWFEERGET